MKRISADSSHLGRMPRSYQVTPKVLGRRRATQPMPVRPAGRQAVTESARRQPENQPHGSDVTARRSKTLTVTAVTSSLLRRRGAEVAPGSPCLLARIAAALAIAFGANQSPAFTSICAWFVAKPMARSGSPDGRMRSSARSRSRPIREHGFVTRIAVRGPFAPCHATARNRSYRASSRAGSGQSICDRGLRIRAR